MNDFEEYLLHKKMIINSQRKLKKKIRRYKKYLNEIYFEQLAIIGKGDNFYNDKIIELMIKNKWLERKIRRLK